LKAVVMACRYGTRLRPLTIKRPKPIEEQFGDGKRFGAQVTCHQDPPGGLGTAGAVRGVADSLDGSFLVIIGDVITDFDLTHACFHIYGESSELAHVNNRLQDWSRKIEKLQGDID